MAMAGVAPSLGGTRPLSAPVASNVDEGKEKCGGGEKRRRVPTADEKRRQRRALTEVQCPLTLFNRKQGRRYQRGKMLGRGGFATCYAVVDEETGKELAAKVVSKALLERPRMRQKLETEIRIHRSLCHANIVAFHSVFEEEAHVYILLERCRSMTLAGLVRQKKRLEEGEIAAFVCEILAALRYIHGARIVHRDLKLSNILFSQGSGSLKVGDFGLACRMESDEDRKTTICGTPNYIAPEVLAGKELGHSFEADIWSVGVMVYTMLIGKPPFESSDVKSTYKRIKANVYNFPEYAAVSCEARDFIKNTLQVKPSERLTLEQLREHPFVIRFFPVSRRVGRCMVEEEGGGERTRQERGAAAVNRVPLKKVDVNKNSGTANDLVAGGGLNAPVSSKRREKVRDNPNTQTRDAIGPCGAPEAGARHGVVARTVVDDGMATSGCQTTGAAGANRLQPALPLHDGLGSEADCSRIGDRNAPPTATGAEASHRQLRARINRIVLSNSTSGRKKEKARERTSSCRKIFEPSVNARGVKQQQQRDVSSGIKNRSSMSAAASQGAPPHSSRPTKSQKKESVAMVSDPAGAKYEYIGRNIAGQSSSSCGAATRHEIDHEDASLSSLDPELRKKVTLLHHFNRYLRDKADKVPLKPGEEGLSSFAADHQPMIYVKKCITTNQARVFRLSNHSIQVNFKDGAQIVLSSIERHVMYTDETKKRSIHSLGALPDDDRLMLRLAYTKDILASVVRKAKGK